MNFTYTMPESLPKELTLNELYTGWCEQIDTQILHNSIIVILLFITIRILTKLFVKFGNILFDKNHKYSNKNNRFLLAIEINEYTAYLPLIMLGIIIYLNYLS